MSMLPERENTDPRELARFSGQAALWWNPKGPLQALHDINPLRVGYIREKSGISGQSILDAGCGGGILSEALAAAGARVTGIDLSPDVLAVARRHARDAGLDIDYQQISSKEMAARNSSAFDVVACMEFLEHVPDPAAVAAECAALVKPGGHVFFSTISRTLAARLLVIFVAERVLGIAEKGTHEYNRLIRPEELVQWGRDAGLILADCSGFMYMPVVRKSWLTRSLRMNYIMHFTKASIQ
ncbi:2-polyprenyl-6-hydroxyphenyl methylase/3-demethylubiquinone-9 3-methyltransferase [Desulfosalsimonas propionicica]|uniref:2-polyprenyl-6-hydroxyphenyl methylase/3-demethylubiquinone-9 3-methyltransferase n=1 Tax=Desulfosalsimonas propionicica TaxID=332175 RepID=A0A7W0C8E5_9BACT|nr:bifunctional 2-polyprenyl-6-hydroxyphenol methylase/3-demethylubiquinol 3-O-methyltransferase UbiG [Desulfosalsimonas propionicica]MBA2881037.1 2-polyprenyl-6-hydroxyphenyl methylase/3-demethylubiquinone-9 3-methyltransferase [Desulfosalsimonas propionicica]